MAILTLVFGRDILETYDINGSRTIIGRADDCNVVIDNLAVSRHHVIIEETENGYLINDLDSNNGTFVNGRRIFEPTPLNFGDEIAIGKHVLLFDSHTKNYPTLTMPHGEALPDMDSPAKGTMFVEPDKMEQIQKKATVARKAHLCLKNKESHGDMLIALDKTEISFGKAEECDIQLKGFFCARKHAVLTRTDKGFQIANYAILSPTRVNGEAIAATFLCEGDEVKMYNTTFIFHSSR